jgi:hypothetical protein
LVPTPCGCVAGRAFVMSSNGITPTETRADDGRRNENEQRRKKTTNRFRLNGPMP